MAAHSTCSAEAIENDTDKCYVTKQGGCQSSASQVCPGCQYCLELRISWRVQSPSRQRKPYSREDMGKAIKQGEHEHLLQAEEVERGD